MTRQGVLDELIHKATYGPGGMYTLWERKLQLRMKPKPTWCPEKLWHRLVNLVVHQTEQEMV